MKLSLLAKTIGAEYSGIADPEISRVSGVSEAETGSITFINNPRYLGELAKSKASAVILAQPTEGVSIPAIYTGNPSIAATLALKALGQVRPEPKRGISDKAIVSSSAKLGTNVSVMDNAFVGDNVQVGDNTVIYPNVYIGPNARIGKDCILYPGVSILDGTIIGSRTIIHSNSVLGSDGFGFDLANSNAKVPQVGIVEVGDDVEIGSCVTIDRARFDRTIIGSGTKIDNQVQIGHNVKIGKNCILVAHVGVAGSTELGNQVVLAAKTGLVGHIKICDNVQIGAYSGVRESITEPGQYGGIPTVKASDWKRQMINFIQLPKLKDTVKDLNARITALEKQLASKQSV